MVTQNTAGSGENIKLLEQGKVDTALVAGEPAYEAFSGIGRDAVQPSDHRRDLFQPRHVRGARRQPGQVRQRSRRQAIAWGTRASGLTLLGKYVMDGLGRDRDKDFEPVFLDKAGDGPVMVGDGSVAALWGGGIGWPGFTAISKAGGRFIGLTPDEIKQVTAKHNFLKPIVVPAGAYEGQNEPVSSVGSWSYILARTDLPDDTAYRLAKALHQGNDALVKRLAQARETTPQNTLQAAPSDRQIHPGVLKYLRRSGCRPNSWLQRS